MSYINKLLDGVEVEWKSLGEVAKIQRGASPRPITNFITEDDNGIPWIKIGDTSPNSKYVTNTEQKITLEGASKSRLLKKGDFIMSNSMSFGRPYILNINGAIHDGWASISDFGGKLNSDYLYHYLSSGLVQNYWLSKINSGSVSNLNSDIIKSLNIPIPPLPVQKEIVRILDAFTELTAELTARKKQYSFYREQLLRFETTKDTKGTKRVEWKTLGEVGEVRMCKRILKEQTTDAGEIPFFKIGTFGKEPNAYISKELFDKYKLKYNYPKVGEVLISASGTIGRAVIFDGQDAYFQDSNIVWIENDESQVLNKYLFYFYQIAKWNIAEGGTIQRLYNDNLKKTIIPIPPLEEQARIVSILDKFDVLTASISEGLPKEIELR
ncbi:MAG: restriction endonuclease subunit S, partial [Saprospiraceae bacterium]|nr:restriction endonuclease subunit S [Saprospiraceae bacterium]